MSTSKEQRFISEYLVDFNGTQAAIRAGYSSKSAPAIASRLLRKVNVAQAVEAKRQQQIDTTDLTAARVLEEMRRLAFSDVRQLFDEDGNLRPLHTLTAEQAACIAGVEVIIKNAKAGDGQTDTIHKIKIWDKPRTMEMLGKHFGLLVDRLDINVTVVGERLDQARRAAARRNGSLPAIEAARLEQNP